MIYCRQENTHRAARSGGPFAWDDMTGTELASWIRRLQAEDQLWKFYKSKEWKDLKRKILRQDHYECQVCKRSGIVTRYEVIHGRMVKLQTVHHVMHVTEHPELALSEFYTDSSGSRQRQLITICKACHNKEHPEKNKNVSDRRQGYTNTERW